MPPSQLTANPDSYAAGQGKALTVSAAKGVLVNDHDPQGKPLIAILDSNPTHGSLTFRPDGSFIYTNDGTGAGQDSFTYQVSNGTGISNITTVTITIGAPDAITPAPDFYSLPHGGSIAVGAPGVLTNDLDPNGLTLTAATLAPPLHGSLTLSPNGGFTYAHDGTNTTSDTFAYRATDGTLTSSSTNAFLTIGPDSPPTVGSQSYTTMENTTLSVAAPGVLTGATDPDSPTITAVLQNIAAHGSVTLNPNGSFVYTPATGFSGADSFTFRGSDGIVSSVNAGTASIDVAAIPRPTAVDDRYVATTSALTINAPGILGNDTMNGGTVISFGRNGNDQTGIGHPAVTSNNGQITLNADGSFTYNAPTPTFSGDDTFRYVIANSSGTSTAMVIVTVAPVNTNCPGMTIGPFALPSGSAGVAYPAVSFSQSGGAAPIAWAAGTLPPGMTFSNAGVLSGTPTALGTFNVTVSATDTNACVVIKTMTLDVGCPPIAISATNLVAGTVGVAYPATTLTLTGGVAPLTWSLLSGALPAGMNLSGNGVLSGTPAQTGAFAFTVQATDANGCSGSRTFILIVNSKCPSIAITPLSLTGGAVGVVYPALSFSQTGGAAPVTWSSGALPPGMSFSTAGVLSGTPTSIGTFNIAVTVVDANGCMFSVVMPLVISGTCPTITATTPTLPTATQGAVYPNVAFQASGGVAPYNWSIILGSLPTGLTLSTSGLLSGTPAQSGSFPFTVQVRDANNCASASQSVTLTVNNACGTITITPSTLPDATLGFTYAAAFTQTGGALPVTWSAGTLPPGLTITAAGLLSGAPTAAGTFNVAVTVTDAHGCIGNAIPTFKVTRPACPTITLSPSTLPDATLGITYAAAFTQTGGALPVTWSAGTLPPGLTITAAGLLSGTPTAAGTFNAGVTVIDANGCIGNATPTLKVTRPACPAITITPSTLPDATLGITYAVALTQAGGALPVTWTAGVLPPGLTITAAGLLSGTPTAAGTFEVAVTVTDANGCIGNAVPTLKVTRPVCPAMTITPSTSTLPDATLGITYAASFTQTGGALPVTWTAGVLPPGLTLTAAGLLSGTPAAAGTFGVAVTVTDAEGCIGNAVPTLKVARPACPAITITSSPSTLPDAALGITYAASFTQTGGALPVTWSAGVLPPGLTITAAGLLSGTPTAAGTFDVGVTVTDAEGCIGNAVPTLKVTRPACPAITITSSPSPLPNATLGITYAASFTQTGGALPVTWSAGTLPPGLTITAAGLLSGTPAAAGSFEVAVTVTDANGCIGNAVPTLTVTRPACPAITVTTSPSPLPGATLGMTYAAALTQSGGALPVTWSAGTLPPGLTITAAGLLSGTPSAAGSFEVAVTVTDANGCIGNAVPTLTVTSPACPDIKITPSPSPLLAATLGLTYAASFTQTGGALPVTWSAGTLPPGLAITAAGLFSGTPTVAGTFDVGVTVTDANGCIGNAVATLTVNTPPCPTITVTAPTLPTGTQGAVYPNVAFQAIGGQAPLTWAVVFGSLPSGMSVSSGGVLSGTPAQSGTFDFKVMAVDSNNCPSDPKDIELNVCGPIVAAANGNLANHIPTFHALENFTVQGLGFTHSGGLDPVTYAVSDGVLPPGISLSINGILTGSIASDVGAGNYPVRIKVTDSLVCSGDGFVYVFSVCNILGGCP